MTNIHFDELLNELDDNHYVGLGNYNAKLLFIGKEAGAEIGSEIYHGNAKSWKDKNDYSKRFVPIDKTIKNLNHTWFRYQKLYEYILEKLGLHENLSKYDKYEVTFVENVFTTELSNLPSPNTNDAKRQSNFSSELIKRKEVFFKSKFIANFSIILIFATDNKYIETYSGEVCELFNVKFNKQIECSDKDKIWVHHSNNNSNSLPKLVLHTRQLTNSISKNLISSIGDEVVDFIKTNNISIIG